MGVETDEGGGTGPPSEVSEIQKAAAARRTTVDNEGDRIQNCFNRNTGDDLRWTAEDVVIDCCGRKAGVENGERRRQRHWSLSP
jgi:hypothetical protein